MRGMRAKAKWREKARHRKQRLAKEREIRKDLAAVILVFGIFWLVMGGLYLVTIGAIQL